MTPVALRLARDMLLEEELQTILLVAGTRSTWAASVVPWGDA